ncbi:MAG: Unknown protein [uncultured Campylobacterales bacterium]|uniref:Uncharacterized protein n=1 Tax=uncultured Campylobacterales bacterium TaxID=352960 RepID=A0A6S6TIJ6_9BACT|nr:MAG: Unknown protein [uncultured Campylobacterales bacterium]
MIKKSLLIVAFSSMMLAGPANDITISDLKEAVVLLIEDVKKLRTENIAVSDEAMQQITSYKETFKNRLEGGIEGLTTKITSVDQELEVLKKENEDLRLKNLELVDTINQINSDTKSVLITSHNIEKKYIKIENSIEETDTALDRKIKRFVRKYTK